MKYITILLTLFLVKSCGNNKDVAALIKTEQLSGTYAITMLGNNESLSNNLTLTFDESTNKISGFPGCNRFIGSFSTNGETITFKELASTKMMCPDENMNTEHYILDALAQVNTYSLKNNVLNLKNETTNLLSAKRIQENIMITYETTTRGFFEIIWISKDSISFSKDRNLIERKTTNCPEKEWQELLSMIQNIDVKTLSELEAPSKKYQSDGAAMATLKIESEGEEYKTIIFDHGHPPKEIEELVNKVLSMKKMLIKE